MAELKQVYQRIEKDLKKVNELIVESFKKSENRSIMKMGGFLTASPGKRIRPALAILSAKASLTYKPGLQHGLKDRAESLGRGLIKIASAIELIHIASLLHDDVIDHSRVRHNKPTINSKWGKAVAIVLGDYLYSVAFELISESGNPDIIHCVSCAVKEMSEGELIQVCERDNLDLLKKRYIVIVKKKTASLFAASCQIGALASNSPASLRSALKEYGVNLGIAFQIVDDYLDLVAEEEKLGKKPGQDIGIGEITLPLLNLLESVPVAKRKALRILLTSKKDKETLRKIKEMLFDSGAVLKTKEVVASYINSAIKKLDIFPDSEYKKGLISLADFIMKRGFNGSVSC